MVRIRQDALELLTDAVQANENRRNRRGEAQKAGDVRVHEEVSGNIQQARLPHRVHWPVRLCQQCSSIRICLDDAVKVSVSTFGVEYFRALLMFAKVHREDHGSRD